MASGGYGGASGGGSIGEPASGEFAGYPPQFQAPQYRPQHYLAPSAVLGSTGLPISPGVGQQPPQYQQSPFMPYPIVVSQQPVSAQTKQESESWWSSKWSSRLKWAAALSLFAATAIFAYRTGKMSMRPKRGTIYVQARSEDGGEVSERELRLDSDDRDEHGIIPVEVKAGGSSVTFQVRSAKCTASASDGVAETAATENDHGSTPKVPQSSMRSSSVTRGAGGGSSVTTTASAKRKPSSLPPSVRSATSSSASRIPYTSATSHTPHPTRATPQVSVPPSSFSAPTSLPPTEQGTTRAAPGGTLTGAPPQTSSTLSTPRHTPAVPSRTVQSNHTTRKDLDRDFQVTPTARSGSGAALIDDNCYPTTASHDTDDEGAIV